MGNNDQLIWLSERGRFWDLGYHDLSTAEQVFRAVWELETEVNNGGFDQYYFNSSGDTAFAVVDALKAIGAESMARIVANAHKVFPDAGPPRDSEERRALLDALELEQKALLENLDQEFYRYPDNLTELLYDFVKRHSVEISGAVVIGIYKGAADGHVKLSRILRAQNARHFAVPLSLSLCGACNRG